jgi:molybdopterin molybdotransferase
VLARALAADRPSPACDVSAMDGYAVRLRDVRPGRHGVAGEVRIGREPPEGPGVWRIVTGAPVPAFADAILKREDVIEQDGAVVIPPGALAAARPGQHVRRRGENAGAGDIVVDAGTTITPAVAAALAAFGVAQPEVFRKVRVGILVTGDEVLAVGRTPSAWEVRDANGPALASLVAPCPWAQVVAKRHVDDDPGATRDAVESLLGMSDALFITGGVSMGDRDYVPGSLRAAGCEVLFHRVSQRPGRPVLGALAAGRPVLALPGNPVSVMVTARRFGGPVLSALAGCKRPMSSPFVALEGDAGPPHALWSFRPVRFTAPGRAAVVDSRGSGDLVGAARSDGFVELPPAAEGPGPWPFYTWELA